MDAWNNLRITAKQWSGLDTFSTVYDEVTWDNGPVGGMLAPSMQAETI